MVAPFIRAGLAAVFIGMVCNLLGADLEQATDALVLGGAWAWLDWWILE